jgi:hypothetical protein
MVNGIKLIKDMEEVIKCLKMVINMKAIGMKIKLMNVENIFIRMVIRMKVIGRIIRSMDMEYIYNLMGLNMKEHGRKI